MLTFNIKDYNLSVICTSLKKGLNKFKIKDYYIFGLKLEGRPHLTINQTIPTELKNLLIKSNVLFKKEAPKEKDTIRIGLRKDVRENTLFAKNLIKTIIFAYENKLVYNPEFKIEHGLKS